MTIGFALEYISRRMKELGHGEDYILRTRHLVLEEAELREIDAYGHLYLLVEEPQDVRISSDLGVFDLKNEATNEMTYEHQGLILVQNTNKKTTHVRFLQAVPKHQKSR